MTDPGQPRDGDERDPREPGLPGWLGGLARAAVPQNAEDGQGTLRLLRRITRAQKVIVGAGALGILVALIVTGQPFPWPLGWLQQTLRSMLGVSSDGHTGIFSAYPVAVALQGIVVLGGLVALWLTMSWRLGRLTPLPLVGFVGAGGAFLLVASRSPTMTLWAWIVIAALAIAYINYYRKGRFGYTRGAAAAVFSHIVLICFFLAFPFVLIEVLGGDGPADVAADAPGEPVGGAGTEPDCSILAMSPSTGRCPEDSEMSEEPAGPEVDLPPHDVRPITGDGRIDVATDATSPTELRALFDIQREIWDPSVATTTSGYRDRLLGAAQEVYGDAADLLEPVHPSMEVRIRCASVPDVPGVDPVLATGLFALTEQGAEQVGLASTDDVLFETSGRSNCNPPPPPPGAVTAEEVFAAVERAGLVVTSPRGTTVPTLDPAAAGLSPCYAYGCLQQTTTDQFMVTVWPTAEDARARIDRVPGEAVAGAEAAALAGFEGWVGALAMGALDPFDQGGVLFGPVTTVHLNAPNHNVYAEAVGCRDRNLNACVDAYEDRLTSAAATLEQAAPR